MIIKRIIVHVQLKIQKIKDADQLDRSIMKSKEWDQRVIVLFDDQRARRLIKGSIL